MIHLCGLLLLAIGIDRVRAGKTGFSVITGFYAILAGFLCAALGLFV